MKNEIIKKMIEGLSKQRENLDYEFKQIGLNDMNWTNAQMNYRNAIMDIDSRIDFLLSQIIE